MKYIKISSWFLAISMFMFGVLKFVDPFKGWYTVQVANSGLGQLSYAMGIMGEIAVGTTLFVCLLFRQRISTKLYNLLTGFSFVTVIIMMLTGVYVHLHAKVPADVLPLKIKPPYIPIFFLLVAFSNLILTARNMLKAKRT
ncbi:hypothetical protein [Flavobacterium sp. UBA6135]|uniref:hypothetical protein n=1 Tax=Flavobacterium sp. UBA6135 TaxID=1946553 RepID=UPI0025C19912|nr:hypothetical protein [Flavobacterium sp. UBA6135]